MGTKYSVVSIITNDYEPVREIANPNPDVEYVLITDNKNLKSNTWKVVYEPLLDNNKLSGIAKALILKYNCQKYVSNDVFVRIDHSVELQDDITPLIDKFNEGNYDVMAMMSAWECNTFDDEYIRWTETFRHIDKKFTRLFFQKMKYQDYDFNWEGCFETTVQIYRKSEKLTEFFNDMIDCLFDEGYTECDPNDQCYNTCLLESKYKDSLKTMCVSNTLLESKYMQWFIHGTQNPIIGKQDIFNGDKYHYSFWRGQLMRMPLFERGKF